MGQGAAQQRRGRAVRGGGLGDPRRTHGTADFDCPVCPSALLRLPEPEPGISQSLVKAFCLGSEFVPLCTMVTLPDGKAVRQFTLGTDPGSFLDAIVGSSRQRQRNAYGGVARWVQWNRHELRLIFDKISNWWQNEGKGLCADRQPGMTRDQVLERHEKVLRVIWRVMLPRCRPGDELSGRIRDLVLDFDTSGLPVLAAFPPLVRLFPDLLEETILRIRRDIFSRDEERAGHAMGALFIWATRQVPCGPVAAPPDLLRDFSSLVSGRFIPALHGALGQGRRMIELLPRSLHGHLVPNFLVGLDHLLEETRYRGPEDLAGSPFRPDQIPEYRFRSSLLAVVISRIQSGDHPTIRKWLDAINGDPLPEIRRAALQDDEDLD